jgi:methylenetetrahydrofolate--tRNA-(uracil-5-)-methyltransferase
MLGGLYRYLSEGSSGRFQPMNSNWGLVDPLPGLERDKGARRQALARRAHDDFGAWMSGHGVTPIRMPLAAALPT